MARKSRKKYMDSSSESLGLIEVSDDITGSNEVGVSDDTGSDNIKQIKLFSGYRAGLYARLSLESEANRERNTIENQMELLRSFVAGKDDIEIGQEYFDISMTGTNFDRPGFNEMMQDIRCGKINCVIVKDLSRLGRNYVDAGNYIERVFPFFDVRFIAVNDNYDSLKDSSVLMLGLSNIFNEHYSRDISKKIRSSERASWKKGECVAGCVAYGLMKDPADKHRIIADPETSGNVVRMFHLFAEHKSYSKVARIMTDEGILSPRAYFTKKRTGSVPEDMDTKWIAMSVREILKNRYYIGNSVHGKERRCVFDEKRRRSLPESEWMIVENTHEGIVSEELFYQVQDIINSIRKDCKDRLSGKRSVAHLDMFKGKVFCADCGRKMYLRKQKGIRPEYICSGRNSYRKICDKYHAIIAEDVEDAVMKLIHSHLLVSVDELKLMKNMSRKQDSKGSFDAVEKEIRRVNNEIDRIREHKRMVYADFSDHLIDGEQLDELMERDKKTEEKLLSKLNELSSFRDSFSFRNHRVEELEKLIETYKNKRKLSKEIADAFVERIEVHKDKSLDISLKYDDLFQEIKEEKR
ncbi:MAG: recombinase family protein [Lachnospiraceae bacterium]|nr:recombinase family protein [Lachnospiraceae bacterium]